MLSYNDVFDGFSSHCFVVAFLDALSRVRRRDLTLLPFS